ncbi:V-type ATPase subunit [Methanofollis fontis]|uniref:V-type ATP synthase subunit C n=1 Tax=Methanofollis fontis TaxID=2052832 RepID=A0A483CWJ8_9EURY|nr:V-type ATPase subunit [Methanofollis fontis]TAJ45580.1 hypothetical protein CUJ86_02320 [Methanofollis fontis]
MSTLSEIAAALLDGEGGTALLAAALAVAIMVAVMLAASAGYFRIILNIALFAQPDARVRAIGNPLVERGPLAGALSAPGLHDLFDHFGRLGHRMPAGTDLDGAAAERLIREHHYEVVGHLIESVPDGVRPFFIAYARMLGAGEAAAIVAMKAQGVPPAAIEEEIVPVGGLTVNGVRKTAHAESAEEVVRRLRPKPFGPLIAAAYTGSAGNIGRFLARVQADSLADLALAARGVDIALSPPVVETAGVLIDTANLRALIRGRTLELEREAVRPHLVATGGFELVGDRLVRAERAGSLPDLLTAISGTRYHPYLAALPAAVRDGDGAALERALDRCTQDMVRATASQYHLGSGPLLRYLVALDYEVRNMRAIAHGLAAGVPPHEIEGVLVVEEMEG